MMQAGGKRAARKKAMPQLQQRSRAAMPHLIKCWSDFQSWLLSFFRFVGEWSTRELSPGQVEVTYTYHLHASNPLFYPLNGLFARLFWRRYLQQVPGNIRQLAMRQEPYLYA
jgi:hypothetical protein